MATRKDVAENPGKYDGTALDVTLLVPSEKGVQDNTTLPNPEGWSFPTFGAFYAHDAVGAQAWFSDPGICGERLNIDGLTPGQRGRMGLGPTTTMVFVPIIGLEIAAGKFQNNGDNPGDGAKLTYAGKTYVYRQRTIDDLYPTPFTGHWELAA